MTQFQSLPDGLPAPEDDGAAVHLPGLELPIIRLPATDGRVVDLSGLSGLAVVYVYPRTGVPGEPLPTGWDEIPGARGCTPQACSFRDHFELLREAGADHVFGLSVQETPVQKEVAERLHLPFPLLSDARHELAHAIRLPMFEVDGMRLLKRITLVITEGAISHVFYPVFPPDKSAADVLAHLQGAASR
ncbi:peroxiredoxin [Xanthobacter tagetidis]|jgi:peroxiredoxin|uniref:Peroxiredoxin n=1 Tax=Xanthobacter tagetidis TaxID=60216 RepID=A0A3L6ZWR4_9HYPH|nr:peroxiredoxin [Xanthobacter tagetidis]MBB6310167.1 peroxiredoxin [Xanthobacter tagetidis]RLP72204.1 peroxiredoxin [Xanthobacter tagetidis]